MNKKQNTNKLTGEADSSAAPCSASEVFERGNVRIEKFSDGTCSVRVGDTFAGRGPIEKMNKVLAKLLK